MTAAAIKTRSKEAGVTIRELGTRSGVCYTRISDGFNGWVQLKDTELQAINDALDAAIADRMERLTKLTGKDEALVTAST